MKKKINEKRMLKENRTKNMTTIKVFDNDESKKQSKAK